VEKVAPIFGFNDLKKLPKINNHPIGGTLPNQTTLFKIDVK
jgi:hypothetical protein